MLKEFVKYIEENRLLTEGDNVLLTVSGGIDSMVMTDLFIRAGFSIGIAHCNFTLRGEESDKDEEMVREFALGKDIKFFSVRFPTKNYAEEHGISIQMAARDLRYLWFEDIRKTEGFDYIALAHNLNDNIETFLINLIRGTGINGLSGMKKSRDRIIRPILFATRQSIENYARKNRIIYREDKSNADTKYIRNKIRHLIIPVLKEINPSIESTLSETAERLGEISGIFSGFTENLRKDIFRAEDNKITGDLRKLNPFLENSAVLFELFRTFSLNSGTVNDLQNIIRGCTGGQILTDTHRIIKNRNELIITNLTSGYSTPLSFGSISELSEYPEFLSVRELIITDTFHISVSRNTACLDFEKISFPVTLRNWKYGDYFYPLGMKHRKKLSDYLTDNKISIPGKENIKILESGNKIIWVIGERIDDRFKVTEETKKVLIIEVKR